MCLLECYDKKILASARISCPSGSHSAGHSSEGDDYYVDPGLLVRQEASLLTVFQMISSKMLSTGPCAACNPVDDLNCGPCAPFQLSSGLSAASTLGGDDLNYSYNYKAGIVYATAASVKFGSSQQSSPCSV